MRSSKTRCPPRGTTIAELPLALWIIFVGIGFPLFILATITLRFALFYQAARESALQASQSQTFFLDPAAPSTALSCVHQAVQTATQVQNSFSGFTINSTNVYIITTPVTTSGAGTPVVTGPNTPLLVVDTDLNMYQIRVVVAGVVQPLVALPTPFFGNIPGLTQGFPVTVSEERVFENPDGLIF